jgi:hypothetical protein
VSVKGDREAGFAHWREVLRLDGSDPTKSRFDFADALMDEGKLDEAGTVLVEANTDSARGAYARALLAFAAKAPDADAKLDAAIEANGFVPAYLVGDRRAPKTSPLEVPPGGREEAAVIAVNAERVGQGRRRARLAPRREGEALGV